MALEQLLEAGGGAGVRAPGRTVLRAPRLAGALLLRGGRPAAGRAGDAAVVPVPAHRLFFPARSGPSPVSTDCTELLARADPRDAS
ncbi:hypothetical protein PQR15_21640 [Streptomyces lydicus]|nr:hypothetical protein [Streptomyces lydicus]